MGTPRGAVEACARSLGAGAAGLVNALDPDRVTLGGFASELHAIAGDALAASYHRGLMRFRRREPPPLLPAQFGDEGPAVGAALAGVDLVTAGLASWVDQDPHVDAFHASCVQGAHGDRDGTAQGAPAPVWSPGSHTEKQVSPGTDSTSMRPR